MTLCPSSDREDIGRGVNCLVSRASLSYTEREGLVNEPTSVCSFGMHITSFLCDVYLTVTRVAMIITSVLACY